MLEIIRFNLCESLSGSVCCYSAEVTHGERWFLGFAGGNPACPAGLQVIRSSYSAGPGAERFRSSTWKHMTALAVAMNLPRNVTARTTSNLDCIVQEWNKLIRLNGVFGCHDSSEKIHRRQAAFF